MRTISDVAVAVASPTLSIGNTVSLAEAYIMSSLEGRDGDRLINEEGADFEDTENIIESDGFDDAFSVAKEEEEEEARRGENVNDMRLLTLAAASVISAISAAQQQRLSQGGEGPFAAVELTALQLVHVIELHENSTLGEHDVLQDFELLSPPSQRPHTFLFDDVTLPAVYRRGTATAAAATTTDVCSPTSVFSASSSSSKSPTRRRLPCISRDLLVLSPGRNDDNQAAATVLHLT